MMKWMSNKKFGRNISNILIPESWEKVQDCFFKNLGKASWIVVDKSNPSDIKVVGNNLTREEALQLVKIDSDLFALPDNKEAFDNTEKAYIKLRMAELQMKILFHNKKEMGK